jgi:hypothetical protein
MKLIQKGIYAFSVLSLLLVTVFTYTDKELVSSVEEVTFSVNSELIDGLANLDKGFIEAQMIPTVIQDGAQVLKILGFKKSNTVSICLVISIAFLIMSYRAKITLDIYEFYNKNDDGTLKFNEIESLKAHYQNCVLGDAYLGSGLFFGLISILIWVL